MVSQAKPFVNCQDLTPVTTMLVLGAGWFGSNFFWGFYSGSMPLFLNRFGESKFMISVVLSLAGVASCTVPPIVGYHRRSAHVARRRSSTGSRGCCLRHRGQTYRCPNRRSSLLLL